MLTGEEAGARETSWNELNKVYIEKQLEKRRDLDLKSSLPIDQQQIKYACMYKVSLSPSLCVCVL